MVVGVLVELSNKNIDRIFEYNVPEKLASNIKSLPVGAISLNLNY